MQKPRKFKQNTSSEQSTQTVRALSSGSQKRIERAVLKTLSYRAMFSYPLTFSQLQNYLITKKPISRDELWNVLEQLISEKRVKVISNGYCLKSIDPVDTKIRSKNSLRLTERAENISRILGKIPWIKFIGVTGSVAAFNAVEEDDIDILIIAEKRRLWLTRGFVFLILKILGELRKDEKPAKKICPNILLDESNLFWPKRSRNIYVAHEVIMMRPVLDRGGVYLRFLSSNAWVGRVFGNLKFWKHEDDSAQKTASNILDLLEVLARRFQLNYMKSKRTTEVTKDNIIHFNREDHTGEFLNSFEKIKVKELK